MAAIQAAICGMVAKAFPGAIRAVSCHGDDLLPLLRRDSNALAVYTELLVSLSRLGVTLRGVPLSEPKCVPHCRALIFLGIIIDLRTLAIPRDKIDKLANGIEALLPNSRAARSFRVRRLGIQASLVWPTSWARAAHQHDSSLTRALMLRGDT